MDDYNRHYITVSERGEIIGGFSDAFRQPSKGDVCINEQGSYQFRLLDGGTENPALFDGYGVPLYRWTGSAVLPRTEAELTADRDAVLAERARLAAMPTREDRIEAQVTYTAMLTDTMLPEEDEDV